MTVHTLDNEGRIKIAGLYPPYQHGAPTGGSSGQHLRKDSGVDYDVSWVTPEHHIEPITAGEISVDGTTAWSFYPGRTDYDHLLIEIWAHVSAAVTESNIRVRYNGDSAAVYQFTYCAHRNQPLYVGGRGIAQNFAYAARVPGHSRSYWAAESTYTRFYIPWVNEGDYKFMYSTTFMEYSTVSTAYVFWRWQNVYTTWSGAPTYLYFYEQSGYTFSDGSRYAAWAINNSPEH
jgi:hypothetical protein